MRYTHMTVPGPAIAPIFRSKLQLALLGELFVTATAPIAIGDLAIRISASQSAVSREVDRLRQHSIVVRREVGRTRLVEANRDLPWSGDLAHLLARTIGPPALLGRELSKQSGIDTAYIFGSWASRFHGEPGPFPRDVDVVVIGSPNVDAVNRACRAAERELHLDVNPLVVAPDEWHDASATSFLGQLRAGPLVEVSIATAPT